VKGVINFICVFFLFSNCTHHANFKYTNCTITIDELLKNDGNKVGGVDTFSNGTLSTFRDKGKDKIRGGYYCFYNNGHLKSYRYFLTSDDYNYNEEYDSLGNIIKVEGQPLTYKYIKLIKNDSVFVMLYFFSMNKEYQTLHVQTDNNNFDVALEDDTLYSTMKHAAFGFKFNNLKPIRAYLDIAYKDSCNNKSEIIRDTISLAYIPNK
jgi:hypothetical protein